MSKRVLESEEVSLPILNVDVLAIIVGEVVTTTRGEDALLKIWTRISLINRAYRNQFIEMISSDSSLRVIFPPTTTLDFSSFSKYFRGGYARSAMSHKILPIIRLASFHIQYSQLTEVLPCISQINSPSVILSPWLNWHHIKSKTYGGILMNHLREIEKRWREMNHFIRVRAFYLFVEMINEFIRITPPTIKEPGTNAKYGCLLLYNKVQEEDQGGEFIFSEKNEKLFISGFSPLMGKKYWTDSSHIYHCIFPTHNGDLLRNRELVSTMQFRVASLFRNLRRLEMIYSEKTNTQ
jgi:hypothetical protein